jgi:hypothetical protein
MTDPELRKSFRIAVGMNLAKLPQLKGKGAVTDRAELDRAIQYFCDGVLDRLALSKIGLVHDRGDTAAIPVLERVPIVGTIGESEK